MVKASKLDKAINKIDNVEIKTLFSRDSLANGTRLSLTFVRNNEKDFRKLFPRYYDRFIQRLTERWQYNPNGYFCYFLKAFLCLELGIVDLDNPETVKALDENGGYYPYGDDEFATLPAKFFKPCLDSGRYAPDKLLKFIDGNSEYTFYFMPLLASANQAELRLALCDYVKNAKLEDSLRIKALRAMLTSDNSQSLRFFIDEIETKDYYRLKAMTEATALLGDYSFALPAKDAVGVLKDALNSNDGRYLNANFIRAFNYANALLRIDDAHFDSFARKALTLSDSQCKQAVLYILPSQSVSKKYADLIFTDKLSLYDLSFFARKINCEFMDGDAMRRVFDCLFETLKNMDKVNCHFKMSEDVPMAMDLSKSALARILAKIAVKSKDRERAVKLDGIYETLREEAQAAYLFEIGNLSKLDKRACALKFLKTDNYTATKYYNENKIFLTYDEAVAVSDFLKTKKEPIKERIIREFIASKDKEKIAEYLTSCKEDYKIAVGEEMRKAFGNVQTDKLKTEQYVYSWDKTSVYKTDYPDKEVKEILKWYNCAKTAVELPNYDSLKSLVAQVEQFIEQHKDYEYKPSYDDALVTFGSKFFPIKSYNDTNRFEYFPLGEELKQLLSNFPESDLAGLLILLNCLNGNNCKQEFLKLYPNNTREATKLYDLLANIKAPRPTLSFGVLSWLRMAIYAELLTDEYKRRTALTSAKADMDNMYFNPARFLNVLCQTDDEQNLKTAAYVLCYWLDVNASATGSIRMFEPLIERDILPTNVAEYMFVEWETYLGSLFSGEDNIMRSDYPNVKFKKFVLDFFQRCIDAELNRGSLATPYSKLISRNLSSIFGADNYLKAIVALRGLTWARSVGYSSEKNVVLSQIVKYSRKSADDSYERFCQTVEKLGVTREELIRAALFNPEFVDYAEKYLNFPHLKLAVYYFYAHLNETVYGEEQERRIEKIKEFSEINYLDFQDGAFDCNWYNEIISNISAKDFAFVYDNAKYVTVGGLHKRAQRFFDAMQGKLTKQECIDRITASRNKDFCLAYSLIPITDKQDLRERYLFLSEFLRQSGKFGAQRQMSERRTVDIALENLARNAGYADTNIFIFEMEAESPFDVRKTYNIDDVEITPVIDDKKFSVSLKVTKNGKTLVALPSKYAKNQTVASLREEIKSLNKKFKRVRASLEQAMCSRIVFTEAQLVNIAQEPIINAVLSKLLLLVDGKLAVLTDGQLLGLNGTVLHGDATVAHAVEMKNRGLLPQAIEYVVKNNVKQPFKQALREIYLKSPQENEQEEVLRFKGYNVDLKKCVATLKTKGWGVSEDIGLRKVYYKTNLVAAIFREFDWYYCSDITDINRELHGIYFFNRKTEEIVPLKDVDDVTFSETLRDVDLMITVSSNTVYDFKLAKSTVEIRQEILKSIASILKLTNVGFLKDNITVKGHYGTYVINIRTGLVFKEGKGNLLLDTVYSVNKALLLDFIDEDPMTADIISKAIVLSNDKAIKDSAILREITD